MLSFENYLKFGKIKKKTPDPEESKALFHKAQDRLEYIRNRNVNAKIAKFVFEDAYDAIRESAQALMSAKGFKPYSHEATISFVKKFYKEHFNEEEISDFDYFRKLRNDSVYRAVEISKEDAEAAVNFANMFIEKASFLLNKKEKKED